MSISKTYLQSRRLFARMIGVFEAMFDGFWLGTLGRRTFEELDDNYYNSTSMYYSAEYNKRGLFEWEEEVVKTYFGNAKVLLLLGAGAGREVFALHAKGYCVDAFECNARLQVFGNDLLTSDGIAPCIQRMGRTALPELSREYDGAIFGWGSYMLIQGSSRRVEYLGQIRTRMKERGRILLSFFPRNTKDRKLKLTIFVANLMRVPLGRTPLELGDSLAPNLVHYFTQEEIEAEVNKAGFDLVFFSKKQYGHAVAEKRR